MKKKLLIIVPVAGILVAIAVWHFFFASKNGTESIVLSGNIDVTQVDLAFKIPGRLSRRLVEEGDNVASGQRVAVLDDTDQRLQLQKAIADVGPMPRQYWPSSKPAAGPTRSARARAVVEQARFNLNELQNGSRNQEIAEAEADLARAMADERTAESQLTLAKNDFSRYEAVFCGWRHQPPGLRNLPQPAWTRPPIPPRRSSLAADRRPSSA